MAIIFQNVINVFFCLLGMFIIIVLIVRFCRNHFSSIKEVEAVITDKQSYDRRIMRISQPPFAKKEYIIIFLTEKKKMFFTVSELSFQMYNIKQKGTLKYKGNIFIDFVV